MSRAAVENLHREIIWQFLATFQNAEDPILITRQELMDFIDEVLDEYYLRIKLVKKLKVKNTK